MYLTYEEYKSFGGILDEGDFTRYEYEAQMRLEHETHKRIYNVDEETRTVIKECILRVLEILKEESSQILGEKVLKFSHDGLSESFQLPAADDYSKKLSGIICDFLGELSDQNGVPLLYRGCTR